MGVLFADINHSFDKLGITPLGWESSSLFDLVEEAKAHLEELAASSSKSPKHPKLQVEVLVMDLVLTD